jgi:hypothetical protein
VRFDPLASQLRHILSDTIDTVACFGKFKGQAEVSSFFLKRKFFTVFYLTASAYISTLFLRKPSNFFQSNSSITLGRHLILLHKSHIYHSMMRTSTLITFLLASTACTRVIPTVLLTNTASGVARNLDDSTMIRSAGDKSSIIRSTSDEPARSFEEARGPYF